MQHTNSITEGSIIKPLLLFFFPILFGTFFQQLYNTVDALVVGNILGKEALAAVGGTTGIYLNLYIGFFVGLSSGATVLISQFFGSRDYQKISSTVHTSMAISLIMGVILTIVGIITAKDMLILLGVPEEILGLSITYINIYFIGFTIMLIYNMGCAILRAVGDSKHPLYYLIISCIVNIILDILFVYYFKMGIAGAGYATVIAQLVAAILVVLSLINSEDALHLDLRKLKVIDFDILKNMFKIGMPGGVQSVLYTISNLIIAAAINSFGVDAIAANTAFGKIDAIFWMMSGAFGIAITTFVGQNFGARKIERVKKSINYWMLFSIACSIGITVICYVFAPNLLKIFNNDPNVIRIGQEIIRYIAPFWAVFIPVEILAGGLRGMGDSLLPTIITAIGIVVVRILWIIIIPNPSFIMVLLVYPVSWIVTSLAFLIYYYGGFYKKHIKSLA